MQGSQLLLLNEAYDIWGILSPASSHDGLVVKGVVVGDLVQLPLERIEHLELLLEAPKLGGSVGVEANDVGAALDPS